MKIVFNFVMRLHSSLHLLFNKNSVARKWLASYYVILLLPIAISIVVSLYAIDLLKTETNRANDAIATQVREAVEARLKDMDQISGEIAKRSTVSYLRNAKTELNAEERVNLITTAKDLGAFEAGRTYIDAIYLYFPNNGYVVKQTEIYTKTDITRTMDNYDGLLPAQWEKMLSSVKFRALYNFEVKNTAGSPMIYYARTVSTAGVNRPDTIAIFRINTNALLNNVQSSKILQDSRLLLTDPSQSFVLSFGAGDNQALPPEEKLTGQQGMTTFQDKMGSYVIAYQKSSVFEDLTYSMLTRTDLFYQKTRFIQVLNLLSIVICLLGGGILSIYLMKRNYSSIDQLIKFLTSRQKIENTGDRDEYAMIRDAMTHIMNEHDEANHLVFRQKQVLRSNYLSKVLKGLPGKGIHLYEGMREFGIEFPSDTFGIILYGLDDGDGAEEHDAKRPSPELLQFVIQNISEELAGQKHIGYAAAIDGMVACLINFKEGTNDVRKEEMYAISSRTRDILRLKFKTELSIAISGIHQGFDQIPTCYQETLDALEYRIVTGKNEIVEYNEVNDSNKFGLHYKYYFPLYVEQQIINSIQATDIPGLHSIIEDLFQRNEGEGLGSVSISKFLRYNLIGTVVRAVTEAGSTKANDFIDELIASKPLDLLQDRNRMKQDTLEMLEKAASFIQTTKDTTHSKLVGELKLFIEGEYTNPNITITLIGDKFELSPYYLSGIFKNETGQGILDFIGTLRLEHAKRLLLETNETIQDISTMVGFADVRSFIRSFKKMENIPPGKYRTVKQ
ncbi:helix-turn-helix domain-containing protein [Paenibacillus roseipurpureus]|uniref:Helix-turn-helix domain-containing protein n=1 Tax=Paenibacillus roseopurpureus TaxID=2918901 RepID=A0AA96LNG0_9BACL|nr:helix-turn-helix domain-containing protein [Paenibacillus sp. MBLB1832]WNR42943.1 helix-turn-helix domain-containing protein [Paenibacillus sp. MBLB1832]